MLQQQAPEPHLSKRCRIGPQCFTYGCHCKGAQSNTWIPHTHLQQIKRIWFPLCLKVMMSQWYHECVVFNLKCYIRGFHWQSAVPVTGPCVRKKSHKWRITSELAKSSAWSLCPSLVQHRAIPSRTSLLMVKLLSAIHSRQLLYASKAVYAHRMRTETQQGFLWLSSHSEIFRQWRAEFVFPWQGLDTFKNRTTWCHSWTTWLING